jgi:hypothetical protein
LVEPRAYSEESVEYGAALSAARDRVEKEHLGPRESFEAERSRRSILGAERSRQATALVEERVAADGQKAMPGPVASISEGQSPALWEPPSAMPASDWLAQLGPA